VKSAKQTGTTAGLAIVLTAMAASSATGGETPALRVAGDAPSLTITDGRQQVLHYAWENVSHKPYVKSLLSAGGLNVLRDAPADHKHHHGIMFAVAADGIDFWSETRANGIQASRQPPEFRMEQRGPTPCGVIRHTLDWKSPEGRAILEEQRIIEIPLVDGADKVRLLTWRTQLKPAADRQAVRLAGSHYFGLGLRFPASMDNAAQFLFADRKEPGPVVRGDERVTPARWCAVLGNIDGKPVTIAVFDHPGNAPHAAHFFTMSKPFAYLSATINLWKQPLEMAPDRPLKLCYGVAVWDGQVGGDEIDRIVGQWMNLLSK